MFIRASFVKGITSPFLFFVLFRFSSLWALTCLNSTVMLCSAIDSSHICFIFFKSESLEQWRRAPSPDLGELPFWNDTILSILLFWDWISRLFSKHRIGGPRKPILSAQIEFKHSGSLSTGPAPNIECFDLPFVCCDSITHALVLILFFYQTIGCSLECSYF